MKDGGTRIWFLSWLPCGKGGEGEGVERGWIPEACHAAITSWFLSCLLLSFSAGTGTQKPAGPGFVCAYALVQRCNQRIEISRSISVDIAASEMRQVHSTHCRTWWKVENFAEFSLNSLNLSLLITQFSEKVHVSYLSPTPAICHDVYPFASPKPSSYTTTHVSIVNVHQSPPTRIPHLESHKEPRGWAWQNRWR